MAAALTATKVLAQTPPATSSSPPPSVAPASSVTSPTASQSAAEALFQEGRRLMLAGQAPAACPKLAESLRLDPGDGTRLLLAQCYERTQRTASAWLLYAEVVDNSRQANRTDYLRVASERLDRLGPRLIKVVLSVAARTAALDGFELRLDGVTMGPATFGVPIPIDPGPHSVEVTARGHASVSLTVRGETASEPVTVTIPELTPLPPPAASSSPAPSSAPLVPSPPPPRPVRPWQPTAGYVTGGVGVVSLALGAYFLQRSLSRRDEANTRCPGTTCDDRGAVTLSQQAMRAGNLATVFLGAGLALTGGGVVLVVSASARPQARTAFPADAMLAWSGRF